MSSHIYANVHELSPFSTSDPIDDKNEATIEKNPVPKPRTYPSKETKPQWKERPTPKPRQRNREEGGGSLGSPEIVDTVIYDRTTNNATTDSGDRVKVRAEAGDDGVKGQAYEGIAMEFLEKDVTAPSSSYSSGTLGKPPASVACIYECMTDKHDTISVEDATPDKGDGVNGRVDDLTSAESWEEEVPPLSPSGLSGTLGKPTAAVAPLRKAPRPPVDLPAAGNAGFPIRRELSEEVIESSSDFGFARLPSGGQRVPLPQEEMEVTDGVVNSQFDESYDSDGGDFIDGASSLARNYMRSLVTKTSAKEATCGYIYKNSSAKSSRRGWQKRWATFDGKDFKYFLNDKSTISSRIIPLNSMRDIDKDILKTNESHPFRFRITTVDRFYHFAADKEDVLMIWLDILAQAIQTVDIDEFVTGGEMAHPDKQGYLKVEEFKGKRLLAIKKDKLCFYNTQEDFDAGCPIHCVEMNIASVKDVSKLKLRLTTPTVFYTLVFETQAELIQWKEAIEESIAEGLGGDSAALNDVYINHSNRSCADCGGADPHWASVNLGVTLCKRCAGIHRKLTSPSSKIRSLRMDFRIWTPPLIQFFQDVGNDEVNSFWEWKVTADEKIHYDVDVSRREEYIMAKYSEGRFAKLYPLHFDQTVLNEALCKAVQYDSVMETLQLVFSGADIFCSSQAANNDNLTPLQLAKRAKQVVQMEFLLQNGAESSVSRPPLSLADFTRKGSRKAANPVTCSGFLSKTGSNTKGDFRRRWCVLDHGVFSYYETEKSTTPKGSVDKSHMISISLTSIDREEFAFELNTTKEGNRTYLLAAEQEPQRYKWVISLAKVMMESMFESIVVPIPLDLKMFESGGRVFIKDNLTNDWQICWIHLDGKKMCVLKKDDIKFDEIDLRKVTQFKQLQSSEISSPAFENGPIITLRHSSEERNCTFYIQADSKKETEAWIKRLEKATLVHGKTLDDQVLTKNNIPLLVDKCINFLDLHLDTEGIYRKTGQNMKISKLLELLAADVRSVELRIEEFSVEDVATGLRRFLRSLEDSLLTQRLYRRWIGVPDMTDQCEKMVMYRYLFSDLPLVNSQTLKTLILHLVRVADHEAENKMSAANLATVFGPALCFVEPSSVECGFGTSAKEVEVVNDLISHHMELFKQSDKERELVKAVTEIKKRSRDTTIAIASSNISKMTLHIKVLDERGRYLKEVSHVVDSNTTAEVMLKSLLEKCEIGSKRFGLFEIILKGELERLIHSTEKVLDVVLKWTPWPSEFAHDSHLCLKPNTVFERVSHVYDPRLSLYGEMKMSDKKTQKNCKVNFNHGQLSVELEGKSSTISSTTTSWKVDDLIVYMGVPPKRFTTSAQWGFTFIGKGEKLVCTKESPYFGVSICCKTSQEYYRWMAAILSFEHPEDFVMDKVPTTTELSGSFDRVSPRPSQVFPEETEMPRAAPKFGLVSKVKNLTHLGKK